MYKLVCGDKNNNKLSNARGIELKYLDDVRKSANINTIENIIFSENMSDLEFTYVVSALSIGSELTPSIELNIARVLFFAACVNYYIKDKSQRIRSIITAMELYQDHDNNYISVINPPIDDKEYISIKWGKDLSLNSYIEFLIPIVYFKSKQTGWVTISKRYPIKLKVNDNDLFIIPYSMVQKLFKRVNGQVAARSIEELKDNFLHEDSDKIADILIFLGFKKILNLTEDFLDSDNKFYFYQHNKLMYRYLNPSEIDEKLVDSRLWREQTRNCYTLLPDHDYILWGDFENGEAYVLSYNN